MFVDFYCFLAKIFQFVFWVHCSYLIGGIMKNAKIFVFLSVVFLFSALFADDNVKGNMIGGDPAMSWEDGGQDFFVMFNSNIDNKIKLYGETNENPQGDTCVESSSFTLDNFHIPEDAIIEKAYLIWMGAVDPAKLEEPTDNKVHLAFKQTADHNVEYAADILAGEEGKGKKLTDAPSFEFEGITYPYAVTLGCTETDEGTLQNDFNIGYFTYRVDITDFFNQIYEINKAADHQEGTGEYYGTYTFSDLDCTDHDAYKCQTTMVSAWSIFFIYRSKHIKPKKIYFYNGLSFVYGTQSVAKVSGFVFGQYPTVRLTTMIAEGDPSLTEDELPPEEISLLGENGEKPYRLKNKCNDFTKDNTHIEVYNSVSSIVNWDPNAEGDDQIKCVSGLADETINYGIDVDTFLLDSEKVPNLQEHLQHVGNPDDPDKIDITLSVNQDAIFTNFMVLSLDIKGSNFDIPGEDEKYSCSCPLANSADTTKDYYCPYINNSKAFYYLVKVQNWGGEETGEVKISDELDAKLDYIPGTTEYATVFDNKGDGTDWTVIPDKDGGKFPLSGEGYKLGEKMQACSDESGKKVCTDKILVRYKVKPKSKDEVSKNYVFSNIAVLKDSKSETPYKTNNSYPLKLKPMTCVPDSQCSAPTPEMCGGVKNEKECSTDKDCPKGSSCKDFKCVQNTESMCSKATITTALGKNSPQSSSAIIIPKDNGGKPLVVGQFTLQSSDCEDGKYFSFEDLRVQLDKKNDQNFEFSNYELIWDVDGDGAYDPTVDSIVNDPVGTNEDTNHVYFPLKPSAKMYQGKSLNSFIIRMNIDYKGDKITSGTSFRFFLEDYAVGAKVKGGDATIADINIKFAEFFLEPTGDYFIATIGPNDPPIPSVAEMNDNIPVLQIRTKALEKSNSIKEIKIKIPNNAVKFGDENGITGISLWIDSNNDGKGDIKVAEKTEFDSNETRSVSFKKFTTPLKYNAGEEKYLVINVDFNMVKADPAMFGKIIIQKGGIALTNSSTVYELPLNSKKFTYACEKGDENCKEPEESKGGCAVLEVENDSTNILAAVSLISALAMLGFVLLRKKLF